MNSEEGLNQEPLDPAIGEAAPAQDHAISTRKAARGGVKITSAVLLDVALFGFGLFLAYYMDFVLPQRDRGGWLILFAIMVGAYLLSFIVALLLRKGRRIFWEVVMYLILMAYLYIFGFFGKL